MAKKTKSQPGNLARKSQTPAKTPFRSKPAISRRTETQSKVGQLITQLRGIEGSRGKRGKSVSRKDFLDIATKLRIAPRTARAYARSALTFNQDGTVSVSKSDSLKRVMEVYTPNAGADRATGRSIPGKRWVTVSGYKQAQQVNAYIEATEQLRVAKTAGARRNAIDALAKFKGQTIRFGYYNVRLLTDPDQLTEAIKAEGSLERYKPGKQ
jgi:hypothetical protein